MEVLEKFEKIKATHKRTMPVYHGKYEWDSFFDGQTRLFEQGLDFEGSARQFSVTARAAAKAKGIKIAVSYNTPKGQVVLQAIREGEESESPEQDG